MSNPSKISNPGPLGAYDDASRRCADIVNTHLIVNRDCVGKWIAIRLSDGGSDGVVYDFREDAVKHQLHEMQCAYIRIPPDGMAVREAASYLAFNRNAYDKGFRMSDPNPRIVGLPVSGFRKELL